MQVCCNWWGRDRTIPRNRPVSDVVIVQTKFLLLSALPFPYPVCFRIVMVATSNFGASAETNTSEREPRIGNLEVSPKEKENKEAQQNGEGESEAQTKQAQTPGMNITPP